MKGILAAKKSRLTTREMLERFYFLSKLLYASEVCTLSKEMEDKVDAFTIW